MPTLTICSAFDLITPIVLGDPTIYFPRTAKINIRPYLAPRLEYQYPGESKQTIFSNGGELSYELKEIYPDGTKFYVFGIYTSKSISHCNQQQLFRSVGSVKSPFSVSSDPNQYNELFVQGSDGVQRALRRISQSLYDSKYRGFVAGTSIIYRHPGNDCPNVNRSYGHSPVEGFSVPENNNITGECQFRITETFDDGSTKIRHQETRDICPTVQQFDCELGDVKTITIKLDSFEALFASDGSNFDNPLVEFFDINSEIVNYFSGNPDNCLLIWAVKRQFVDNAFHTGEIPVIRQIVQICSAPGCPSPQFNHQCFSDCEECPDNTCPVECGDHICCYDDNGKSIKEIPIENYCNE